MSARTVCVFLVALLAFAPSVWSGDPKRELLRQRLEAGTQQRFQVADELVHASTVLPRFYVDRGFELAWAGRRGAQRLEALIAALLDAPSNGLDPRDYHLEKIQLTRQRLRTEDLLELRVDLDLLCTDAFLLYGSHLVSGFLNPESIDPEWTANRREVDLVAVLAQAVDSDDVGQALESLLPDHPGYGHLKRALSEMRAQLERGAWGTVAAGPKLEVGMRHARVAQLRSRLGLGDPGTDPDSDLFDQALVEEVVRFQDRHGLEPDGIVGAATLAALNVPARDRERQIVINLERWRWLPQDLGDRYILVNVPAFTTVVVEDGKAVLEMRAVVGRQYRRTPVFSARMTYVVLNPYWEVPHSIATNDKLPEMRKDPEYLVRQRMRVFSGWGGGARELAPHEVDWSSVSASSFPYRLRQDPGPLNALGRAKFMFPNKHNVYLHDTPQREHFARAARSFSSGCIRIEKPLELAEYLVSDDAEWSAERIRREIEANVTTTLTLRRPIPVHILYWTAWADDSGTPQFREDIYGRDRAALEALRADPPSVP